MTQVRMSGELYVQMMCIINAARAVNEAVSYLVGGRIPLDEARVALDVLGEALTATGSPGKAAAMPSEAEPDPPMLYGVWHKSTKLWCANSSGRIVSSSSKDISTSTWGTEAEIEVREIPPAMRWWLARGVNVVG